MAETATSTGQHKKTTPWLQGLLQVMPVVMGYIPVGFAYGVLAGQAHLSAFSTLLMSLLVYAGSAQLIATGLFASGEPMLTIIFTTFIVNLRHLLFSAALAPALSRWSTLQRLLFAVELTDEAFALHSLQFASQVPDKRQVYTVNVIAQLSWIVGSMLGFLAGSHLTDVRPFGLDYALPAMFVALLLLQIKNGKMVLVAIFTGVLSVALQVMGVKSWAVILATLIGATLGVWLEVRETAKHGQPETGGEAKQ